MASENPGPGRADRPVRLSFIVRLSNTGLDVERQAWLGTIEHARDGQVRAFSGAEGLLTVLERWLTEQKE